MKNPSSDDSSKHEFVQPVGPPVASSSSHVGLDLEPDSAADAQQNDQQTRVCRKCSVQTQTVGDYCPSCGTAYVAKRRFAKVNKRIALIVVIVLVAVIAGIGIALNVQHTNQVNAEQAAAAAATEAQNSREAEAARAAAAATAAKQAADASKRTQRKVIVTALEESILKDAESRVTKGVLTGPITRASCTPLGGGSSDDLTAITGTFQCIAVNKTEADSSSSGYRFSATVNWNEASYSWHLGS
ncbi:hypothetical protein [Arthrobacter sp. PsM3]|uniref:hypothetical protein n=1 Tax=Arthrobacter sp. PsM3 TaxID=3030531 RepID=UPI00263A7A35|nr:hypothetical protein [Arthrobacter sp. PsM3]MDN4644196.1 hypothetical protein [Arthrobacter sp. PsM3]